MERRLLIILRLECKIKLIKTAKYILENIIAFKKTVINFFTTKSLQGSTGISEYKKHDKDVYPLTLNDIIIITNRQQYYQQ